jgi:hypothetical protein
MASVRHRRRVSALGVLAVLAPSFAVALAVVAIVVAGPWPRFAAAAGAAVSVALGFAVLHLQRRRRVDVATMRAEQAAEYAVVHSRYSDEHRDFTDHMVGLLDLASERIDIMRGRLDTLEAEVTHARGARPGASTPSVDLARLASGAEWNDLWPDLSEAPTVVDLVAWDDRNRALLDGAAEIDTRDERTA